MGIFAPRTSGQAVNTQTRQDITENDIAPQVQKIQAQQATDPTDMLNALIHPDTLPQPPTAPPAANPNAISKPMYILYGSIILVGIVLVCIMYQHSKE